MGKIRNGIMILDPMSVIIDSIVGPRAGKAFNAVAVWSLKFV